VIGFQRFAEKWSRSVWPWSHFLDVLRSDLAVAEHKEVARKPMGEAARPRTISPLRRRTVKSTTPIRRYKQSRRK